MGAADVVFVILLPVAEGRCDVPKILTYLQQYDRWTGGVLASYI